MGAPRLQRLVRVIRILGIPERIQIYFGMKYFFCFILNIIVTTVLYLKMQRNQDFRNRRSVAIVT